LHGSDAMHKVFSMGANRNPVCHKTLKMPFDKVKKRSMSDRRACTVTGAVVDLRHI
jgi:hypothetical protein